MASRQGPFGAAAGGRERVVRECWFCGEETPPSWHDHVLGLHKDTDTTMTPFIIVLRSTWRMEIVSVPRCARCHTGHQLERTAAVLSVAALIAYAASGQLDRLLGILSPSTGERVVAAIWAAVACLPGLVWIAIRLGRLPWQRLAPRRMGYARHHPEYLELRADGWKPRAGPLHYWRSPPNPHHPPPANRPRRLIGGSFELLGAACGLAVPVAYFQGYEELAGVLIAATAGLLFVASKVKPED
ncbi:MULTISPECIES: hypothetical protein [unclassified Streptomyces]|uniref:hypothetical protein n=1 Tax=unclassified Streptomyces TaxID=2593676 RepID=UPI001F07F622|nr:hypothetical protein [Streptomyces sp. CB09001]